MTVQAKFRCVANRVPVGTRQSMNLSETAEECRAVHFTVSYGDGEENRSWSKYTPSGSIEMWVTNPAAFEQFEEGKDYILTFEPAE